LETVLCSRAGLPMQCRVAPLSGGSAMLTIAEGRVAAQGTTPCNIAG